MKRKSEIQAGGPTYLSVVDGSFINSRHSGVGVRVIDASKNKILFEGSSPISAADSVDAEMQAIEYGLEVAKSVVSNNPVSVVSDSEVAIRETSKRRSISLYHLNDAVKRGLDKKHHKKADLLSKEASKGKARN